MALQTEARREISRRFAGETSAFDLEIVQLVGLSGPSAETDIVNVSFERDGTTAQISDEAIVAVEQGQNIDGLSMRNDGGLPVDVVSIPNVEPTGNVVEIQIRVTSWTINFISEDD